MGTLKMLRLHLPISSQIRFRQSSLLRQRQFHSDSHLIEVNPESHRSLFQTYSYFQSKSIPIIIEVYFDNFSFQSKSIPILKFIEV